MSAKPKIISLLFATALMTSSVFAQEKMLFPVSASTKSAGYMPLWVALKQGFFSQQGLDVQLVVIRGSDKATQALVGGSVNVSVSAPDAPMTAMDRGLDTVIVAGNSQLIMTNPRRRCAKRNDCEKSNANASPMINCRKMHATV